MQDINKFTNIIFDFDGTIADTLSLLVDAINHIAITYKYNIAISQEQIKKNSIKDIIKNNKVSLLKLPFLLSAIYKYMKTHSSLIEPVKGITKVLKELKSNSYELSIISSNNTENINDFLKKYDLENTFKYLCTQVNIFTKHKAINRFLNKYNLNKEHTVYIGDEVRDILAAKESGIKVISVSWGFNDSHILEQNQPDFIVHTPNQIFDLLKLHQKAN